MTSAQWTNSPTSESSQRCQEYSVYSRIGDPIRAELLAVAVSSSLDWPNHLEHRVWVEHLLGSALTYDNSFSGTVDSIRSPNTTSRERPPAMPPASSTSNAINWERILLRTDNAYETGEELLRQLGLLKHAQSHNSRLRVLTDSLGNPDPRIRDTASLGLSFLHDPAALPKLRSAYSTDNQETLSLEIEASYRTRIQDLRDDADADGFDVRPSSESDFWDFVRMVPDWKRASLVLADDGSLQAAWLDDQSNRIDVEFIGNGIVVLARFVNGRVPSEYKRCTLTEAIENIREQGLAPTSIA